MPLQLRRGLESERQALTEPLLEGEPLFITDTNQLYIGKRDGGGDLILAKDLDPAFPEVADLSQDLDTKGYSIFDSTGPLLLGNGGLSTSRCVGLDFNKTDITALIGNRTYVATEYSTTTLTQNKNTAERWRGRVNVPALDLNGFEYAGNGIYGAASGFHVYTTIQNSSANPGAVAEVSGIHSGITLLDDIVVDMVTGVSTEIFNDNSLPVNTFIAFKANTEGSLATERFALYCDDPDGKISIQGDLTAAGITWRSSIPVSSFGVSGDTEGMMASDNTYLYRCIADWDGITHIWVRVAYTGGAW